MARKNKDVLLNPFASVLIEEVSFLAFLNLAIFSHPLAFDGTLL